MFAMLFIGSQKLEACEQILSATVEKCLTKAEFKADNDTIEENLQAGALNKIVELCDRGQLNIHAETLVAFESRLVT